ncbi:MAG TPA: hypothetical protein VG103_04865 [Chthoniobacterales bacterium]|jgi:hypothetical protein|nr:hypothetical protein [Chthoniobacterales bacterium]
MFQSAKSLQLRGELTAIRAEIDSLKVLVAQPLIQNIRAGKSFGSLHDAEFRVFSQFGDDGIIQYLIHRLAPLPDTFVEFGVENYRESNTRFLLLNNNWRGLVLDSSQKCVDQIQRDEIYWRHTLTAKQAWITRDNINDLIGQAGWRGAIGILGIDIDGNDYWVWEKLEVVDPVIVVIEYNSIFGPELAVTIPYERDFVRHKAHYSGQFWGASLSALELLAKRKGYSLAGCNSAGNNAYFIRDANVGDLPVLTPRRAFVDARWRDSRDENGKLSYLIGADRFEAIAGLEVYDVRQDKSAPLRSLIQPKRS